MEGVQVWSGRVLFLLPFWLSAQPPCAARISKGWEKAGLCRGQIDLRGWSYYCDLLSTALLCSYSWVAASCVLVGAGC